MVLSFCVLQKVHKKIVHKHGIEKRVRLYSTSVDALQAPFYWQSAPDATSIPHRSSPFPPGPTIFAPMKKTERLQALVRLADAVRSDAALPDVFRRASHRNSYFTEEFVNLALEAVLNWNEINRLNAWTAALPEQPVAPKKVGLLLAGNLPLVGWHDVFSVFVAGHIACYKPSQQDEILIDYLISKLQEIAPEAAGYFQKVERLNEIDALIATGSSTTALHFDYYFRHIPRVIRGSKSSLGIVYGFEGKEELRLLCDDVMQYFGMGCRSVTKILVPEGFDFHPFFEALEKYRYLTDHHRYQNNAIYHKSIFLMNGDAFLDNDIVMLRNQESLFSPQGVLHYQYYGSQEELRKILESHKNDLQCFVSAGGQFPGSIPFGKSQQPAIDDYADGINTLEFLAGLS